MKFTDEECLAVEEVLASWGIRKQREDMAAEILNVVAPMIVKRDRSRFVYSNVGSKRRGW
jgi:hypothetical protein